MESIEPFLAFLARTEHACAEQYSKPLHTAAERYGLSPEQATAEFERMKSYILGLYEGVTPVSSFLSVSGQPVDCVLFEQLPTVRAARAAGYAINATPPPPMALPGIAEPGHPSPPTASDSGHSLSNDTAGVPDQPISSSNLQMPQIPPGTVPLMRVTLDRLIPLGRLENFFRKAPGHHTTGNQPLPAE